MYFSVWLFAQDMISEFWRPTVVEFGIVRVFGHGDEIFLWWNGPNGGNGLFGIHGGRPIDGRCLHLLGQTIHGAAISSPTARTKFNIENNWNEIRNLMKYI